MFHLLFSSAKHYIISVRWLWATLTRVILICFGRHGFTARKGVQSEHPPTDSHRPPETGVMTVGTSILGIFGPRRIKETAWKINTFAEMLEPFPMLEFSKVSLDLNGLCVIIICQVPKASKEGNTQREVWTTFPAVYVFNSLIIISTYGSTTLLPMWQQDPEPLGDLFLCAKPGTGLIPKNALTIWRIIICRFCACVHAF